jgi:hypothetical protein
MFKNKGITSAFEFLISSFCRVLYVVCFLLGNYPAYGVYMPTFRNTLFHLHRQVDVSKMKIGIRNDTGKGLARSSMSN